MNNMLMRDHQVVHPLVMIEMRNELGYLSTSGIRVLIFVKYLTQKMNKN